MVTRGVRKATIQATSSTNHRVPKYARPTGGNQISAVGSSPDRLLAENPDHGFRLARVLYYAGMGFVAAGAIRPLGGLDISDYFFFASLIVAVGTMLLTRSRLGRTLPGLFIFGVALLVVGVLFSLPTARYAVDSAGALARFIFTVVIWFALGSIVLRTPRHIENAIAAWILSVAASGLAAIAQVKLGAEIFASFTTVPLDPLRVGFAGRQIGFSQHPNDLGAAAAIVVAPAILFATTRIKTGAHIHAFIALLCLVMACIALSGSVTAFGVGTAAALAWIASGRVAVKRLIPLAGILGLTGIALVLINQQGSSLVLSPIDRVSQSLGLVTAPLATGLERLNLDVIAWDAIARHPVFGVGLDGNSVADEMGGVGVHNMFLFVWVGAGVFGLLGLVTMTASLATAFVAEYRRSLGSFDRTLVLALGISFASFLVVALASPIVFTRYAWAPAALLLPLRARRLRNEEMRQVVVGAEPRPGVGASALPSKSLR